MLQENTFQIFEDQNLQKAFEQNATLMKLPAGGILMSAGETIRFIPLVKSGCIRVLRQNEDGNETFLYHIMPGETCAMSLTCCNGNSLSEVKALAEEDTELYAIPIQEIDQWQQYKEWRNFMSFTYKNRFERLLQTIDDLAFQNMDERLWKYLLARSNAKGNKTLQVNHDEIGQELNIQRESATRLLKKLKDSGYIETSRGQVTLLKSN